jgi:ligand-binding sensor protein
LVDASSPFIIEGENVANVFAGQIFLEAPDETKAQFFREQPRNMDLTRQSTSTHSRKFRLSEKKGPDLPFPSLRN